MNIFPVGATTKKDSALTERYGLNRFGLCLGSYEKTRCGWLQASKLGQVQELDADRLYLFHATYTYHVFMHLNQSIFKYYSLALDIQWGLATKIKSLRNIYI
jgi:hypothetical protein